MNVMDSQSHFYRQEQQHVTRRDNISTVLLLLLVSQVLWLMMSGILGEMFGGKNYSSYIKLTSTTTSSNRLYSMLLKLLP